MAPRMTTAMVVWNPYEVPDLWMMSASSLRLNFLRLAAIPFEWCMPNNLYGMPSTMSKASSSCC